MKLNNLKQEEEKIAKKLLSYKKSLFRIFNLEAKKKKVDLNPLYFTINLSELNKNSLRAEDNHLGLQIQRYKGLIEKCSSFGTLYKLLTEYKETMWEKEKIKTMPEFDIILKQILKEINSEKN